MAEFKKIQIGARVNADLHDKFKAEMLERNANQHEQEWSHDSNHNQLELAQTLGHHVLLKQIKKLFHNLIF